MATLFSTIILLIITTCTIKCQFFGPNGIDCDPPTSNDPPVSTNVCSYYGQLLSFGTTTETGYVACKENFDCCLCSQIQCNHCGGYICNGDSSCRGASSVTINGDANIGGADVECNGDNSCQDSMVFGVNINEVGCTGDYACAGANFHLICILPKGCLVACVGDNSCDGTTSRYQTQFDIQNSNGMECSDEGCKNGIFWLTSNIGGALSCDSEEGCSTTEIHINNIEYLSCGGFQACLHSGFYIDDPQNLFYILCTAFESCQYAHINIMITNGITEIKEIQCSGLTACTGLTITILSKTPITIEKIECTLRACDDFRVLFPNNVNVLNCIGCPANIFEPRTDPPTPRPTQHPTAPTLPIAPTLPPVLAVGETQRPTTFPTQKPTQSPQAPRLGNVVSNLEKFECGGTQQCANQVWTIINPLQDFELSCGGKESCLNLLLILIIEAGSTTDFIKGYKCGNLGSCFGMTVAIYNEAGGILQIEKVECSGTNACFGATFENEGAVIRELICGGNNACFMCTNDGTPC